MKKALFYLVILFPFMHLFGQWKPTNELFIEHGLEKNGNCSLLIYDLSGKIILKRHSNSHSMREDVSHLESGTYFGVVISDGDNSSQKFKFTKVN